MNIRFGLYFIPNARDELYKIGSSTVGYDVRNRMACPTPSFIKPQWLTPNAQFGFHATITDAITVPEDQVADILQKTERLLSCLRPDNRYILTKERVGFWRDSSNMAAVIMKPNRSVELLHDLLVASLHPLGFGSEYYDSYRSDPQAFQPNSPASLQKTKQFYSPYIFDEFIPHFTCIGSYDDPLEERATIERHLEALFQNINQIEFSSIAFVTQREGDAFFRIEKEFNLSADQEVL